MNKDDVAKLYAQTAGPEALERERRAASARCKRCDAAMRWVTAAGRPMPVDFDPHEDGNVLVHPDGRAEVFHDTPRTIPDGATVHFSHFATCPNAAEFRAGRAEPQAATLF